MSQYYTVYKYLCVFLIMCKIVCTSYLNLYIHVLYCRTRLYEKQVIHSVESVVIEWCHLIRDVLNKNSAETLLAGMNPGPLVEIEFWNARCADLESVVDQVQCMVEVDVLFVYMHVHVQCICPYAINHHHFLLCFSSIPQKSVKCVSSLREPKAVIILPSRTCWTVLIQVCTLSPSYVCGVAVAQWSEHQQLKAGNYGFDSCRLPICFSLSVNLHFCLQNWMMPMSALATITGALVQEAAIISALVQFGLLSLVL